MLAVIFFVKTMYNKAIIRYGFSDIPNNRGFISQKPHPIILFKSCIPYYDLSMTLTALLQQQAIYFCG